MNAPLRRALLVVERLPSRSAPVGSAALPEPVLSALAAIVRDMRDVPRDCLRDPAELFVWLRRMAGRVEGVGRMRVPAGEPAQKRKPTPMLVSGGSGAAARSNPTPRALAEAVFATVPKTPTAPIERRTVTSRKGRAVPVEIRRARAAGQMDLWS